MKQMITRLDDELHARLKAFAAAEGRSLNEITIEALTALVSEPMTRNVLRERLRAAGRLKTPAGPVTRPDPKRVQAARSGTGHAVSEALQADRGAW